MHSLNEKIIGNAITFDDVLVVPNYSEILPNQVNLQTRLNKDITLNIPILSAAMDSITEANLAICLALHGGVGIIHKNFSIKEQVQEIKKVKKIKVNNKTYPKKITDNQNQLIVGAAIGTESDYLKRVSALIKARSNIIVVDSAHGHSKKVLEVVKNIKKNYPNICLIAGNICTKEAALALINAGADVLKVGIGPGSICTTRIIAGIGVPQLTAINEIYQICKNKNISVIADGGIKYSGDIVKAIAAGADCVMIGNLLAGTDKTPGEIIIKNNQQYKTYIGMGSIKAMKKGSSERYFQKENKKLVPEGIEALVPYKGKTEDVIFQLTGGLKAGMGYTGNQTIEQLKTNSKFILVTNSSIKESHPNDFEYIKETINYQNQITIKENAN